MAAPNTFEALLKELEQIAKALESKEISLDDAVKKYQQGIELSKQLHKILEDAQKVIVEVNEQ